MAKRYSAEQWAASVAEQRESALSVRDFCDSDEPEPCTIANCHKLLT